MRSLAIVVLAALIAPLAAFQTPGHISRGATRAHANMGFFDELKGAFDNDPRLQGDRDVNREGVNKKGPAYVKEKTKQRQQYEAQYKKDGEQGDRKISDLFKDFTWK